jgi:Tfp pilus assembly protein FimT
MAVATLGAGFATGEPLYFVAGATAYVLGWVYLPDMRFFQQWLGKRASAQTNAAEAAELAQFKRRREALLGSLSSPLRERYHLLAKVCRDIEKAAADNELGAEFSLTSDTRLRKIDELMWMYLRLLSMQQSLQTFLETERHEDLAGSLADAEQETRALEAEVQSLGDSAASDKKQRLLESRRDRLEVLRKRVERVQEAESNLELVLSEQERLAEQIKLIRADAVATKSASAVRARIDASVEHLNETNKWLSEMDQFRDLAGDLPMVPTRVGFEAGGPPPLPSAGATRPQQRARQRQG